MVTCRGIAQTGVGPLGRLVSCFLFVTNLKSRFTCYSLIKIYNSGKLIGFLAIIKSFNVAFETSSFYCVVTGLSLNTSSNKLNEIFLNAASVIGCCVMTCINAYTFYFKLQVFSQTLILKLYYLFQSFRTVLRSASSSIFKYT